MHCSAGSNSGPFGTTRSSLPVLLEKSSAPQDLESIGILSPVVSLVLSGGYEPDPKWPMQRIFPVLSVGAVL